MKIITMKLNDLAPTEDEIIVPLHDLSFSWVTKSSQKNNGQIQFELIILDEVGQRKYQSGIVESSDNHFSLVSADLLAHTTYYWQVRITDKYDKTSPWSNKMKFTTELNQWNAKWIEPQQAKITEEAKLDLAAMFGGGKLPEQKTPDERLRPVQYLRKTFNLKKPVKKAQLFMTAHGLYQPSINGQAVTATQFMPDFTSYKDILQYQYFNITNLISANNTWDVLLADGWYSGRISTTGNGAQFGDKNGILGEIIITYSDGTQEIIATNKQFKSTVGKYTYSDIFIGEKQDLRQNPDWKKAVAVDEVDYGLDNLIPQVAQYVHGLEPITAKKIWYDGDDLLVDFGQVIAGRVRLKSFLEDNVIIKLEHSEVLDQSGHFFNNITGRNKDQTDYFIGRGKFETIEPNFTFHGFRFVKITGLSEKPDLTDVQAIPLMTQMKQLGSLKTSNNQINQLIENINWSQRGNMLSIPTDCPQRERAGWTGDAQVFMPTAVFNMDVTAMIKRWLMSVRAEQRQDGQIQDYAPAPKEFYTSSPQFTGTYSSAGWGDAIVMIPWTMYMNSGDLKVLKDNYQAMQRWHEFAVKSASKEKENNLTQYVWDTKFHYGDWMFPSYMLGENAKGPMETAKATQQLVGTAFLGYMSRLLAKIAETLGDEESVKKYKEYGDQVAKAFQKYFWNEKTQKLSEDFQGCYVLAIAFNLLDADTIKEAVERLVQMIHENHDCLDTGFLSVPYLLDVLKENGYGNLAETVLLQTKMPSWLYEVDHGATTVWESWGGIAPDGSVGTFSFNHYAFGCVEHWLTKDIGGLHEVAPGYRKFKIEIPQESSFTSSNLKYESENGLIIINWQRNSEKTKLKFSVPFNTTAQVLINGEFKNFGSGDYELNI